MRVLWFSNTKSLYNSNSYERGKGTGNWISSLENAIKNNPGIELGVAFYDNCEQLKKENKNSTIYYRIPTYITNKFLKLKHKWSLKVDYKNHEEHYIQIIGDFKPDIIQVFGLESPFVKIASLTRIPVVFHIQGLLLPYSYFYYPKFSFLQLLFGEGLLQFLRGNSDFFQRIRIKKMIQREKREYKNIKYLIGRTDWDRYCSKILFPKAQYYYCNEIMRYEFYGSKWCKSRSDTIVLFTTIRETYYKGIDFLFETYKILKKYRPDSKIIWRIAGLTKDDLSARLCLKKIRQFNSDIELLGFMNAKELINAMLNSDIFVYPSRIENGCNAVQEAMLIGMPIVCTNSGGMSTTITHKVDGISIHADDPFQMAGAILELIENQKLAMECGENARSTALKRHNINTIINKIIEIYNDIISKQKSTLNST
jgi:glycosyltransferase involved in cell wall biosynthesis